ncbi:FepA family TonB-dependent siderophore receptor [Xinfangfangia sp. D13-10-4-6]|uniref:FepA family TonB-dependent siderophore receptor n=1 Tax=Pseudogemmobacter hezensis TaxID=2737662 RepID=UPI001551C4E2|nr:FepA family TonB-dependent siderophore receptor [Pseudogemmobacter hezensis]NPD16850.1 FepA family TonB-dependent siderophore receptor [Pseudogemmobacter hezensis]
MAQSRSALTSGSALGLLLAAGFLSFAAQAQTTEDDTTEQAESVALGTIILSAEDQIKQALGVSNISAEDIAKQPIVNDIAQIIRKQPGVNLTGTTASGAYGNNRQIDIRGMGPENTLILIDGKPVNSRSSAMMGRSGERDTKGDSNWVPAELVERIEVIRGPAAARYGSGASGGVVNIITKKPTEATGAINLNYNIPQSNKEGSGQRANFMYATPIGENFVLRLNGNYNKTEPDDPDINTSEIDPNDRATNPAGRSGTINKDLGVLLSWTPVDGHKIDFDLAFSRQSTIYTGEAENSNAGVSTPGSVPEQLLNTESRVIHRRNLAITHEGEYDFGKSFSYLQWERTRNATVPVGQAGAGTGQPSSTEKYTNELDSINLKSEWVLPFAVYGRDQSLTLGAEFRYEKLSDPRNFGRPGDGSLPNVDPNNLTDQLSQKTYSLYAESNLYWTEKLTLTPAVRYDYNSNFGGGFSPSLNATYDFTDEWQMKVGIGRAFKAPNLYQLNPTYYWNTMGNGCPIDPATGVRIPGPCYVVGNPDLQAEYSINKEIGFAYTNDSGLTGSLTWFRNDYKNRIAQSRFPITAPGVRPAVLVWENTPKALVEGLEGNFATPLGESFFFNANATYMIESKEKQTGQPLSLIPEYTINASLDWYANDDLTVTLSATHYGKIEAPTFNTSNGAAYAYPDVREAYTLFGLNANWQINDTVTLNGGIDNLFDKKLFRTGRSGDANSYNEPGRQFYISLNTTF